jgi:phosphoglycerate dehydrogenase-like enzyme
MIPLEQCHVLVTPTSYGRYDDRLCSELEAAVGRVTFNTTGKPLTSTQLQDLLADVDGYIAGLDEIDAAALNGAPRLRVVARYGVGTNNVDLVTAAKRGIVVTNTPGANAVSVAELTVALLLNLFRPVLPAVTETRGGGWPRMRGLSIAGKTIGLIGLGAIGQEVARRLSAFDCRLLAFDVAADEKFAGEVGATLISQSELLAQADVVSLHVPVLPATRGMVNAEFLAQMKPGAYLINTARGELIDEAALLAALESERLAGAALDAFQTEPPPPENPLLRHPRVLPTPHMGAHTDGAANTMGRCALADCLAVLRGEEPRFPVQNG